MHHKPILFFADNLNFALNTQPSPSNFLASIIQLLCAWNNADFDAKKALDTDMEAPATKEYSQPINIVTQNRQDKTHFSPAHTSLAVTTSRVITIRWTPMRQYIL